MACLKKPTCVLQLGDAYLHKNLRILEFILLVTVALESVYYDVGQS